MCDFVLANSILKYLCILGIYHTLLNYGLGVKPSKLGVSLQQTSIWNITIISIKILTKWFCSRFLSGIVFTHGIRMTGRWAAGGSLSGLYLGNLKV